MKRSPLIFAAVVSICGSRLNAQQPEAALATASTSAPVVPGATAQSTLAVHFKDGKTLTAFAVKRRQNELLLTVSLSLPPAPKAVAGSASPAPSPTPQAPQTAEVGYPASLVARIDFPKPREIDDATNLLLQDKGEEALACINPVVDFYKPFQDIPGNWWSQAASVKLSALAVLHREKEAEPLIDELSQCSSNPEAAESARAYKAGNLVRNHQYQDAAPVLDGVLKESKAPGTLAMAWVLQGDLLLGTKQYEPAVLAYLHVPVYFPEEKLQMPPALLGSARAFEGMGNSGYARTELDKLTAAYPNSPDAAAAKDEIKKLDAAKPSSF